MEISILSNDVSIKKLENIIAKKFLSEDISTEILREEEDGARDGQSVLNIIFSEASYAAFAITVVYDLTKFALKELSKSKGESSKVILILKDGTPVELSKNLSSKEINRITDGYLKAKKIKKIVYK